MATKNINLEEKEIYEILVALKQRMAVCQRISDDSYGFSLDYDVSDPRRKLYDESGKRYSDKVNEFSAIIKKLESL